MKLPKIRFTKKVIAIGAAAGIAMGAAGIAAAFFSSTGSGTGASNVGHSTAFAVAQQTGPVGTMYPNHGTSKQLFDITNDGGGGTQHYTVHATGGAEIATTAAAHEYILTDTSPVAGCKASWFRAHVTATPNALSGTLAPGARAQVTVTVTMSNGTGTTGSTQNTCQGTHPKVILLVNS